MAVKPYSPGHFALSIDGVVCGHIKDVELPGIEGDVAEFQLATDNFATKAVANFKYSPAKLTIGLGQGKHLWKWLEAALNKGAVHKQCSIILADADLNEMNTIAMEDVFITECAFPAFKGDGKDLMQASISLQATRVRFEKAGGGKIQGTIGTGKQKNFTTNNFELKIGDFDESQVKEVDAIKWENKLTQNWTGKFNEPDLLHTKITRSDLTVTWAGSYAPKLQEFASSWFKDGKRSVGNEMQGLLQMLGPDLKPLGGIEFAGVGLKSIKYDKFEAGADKAFTVKTVFYVEHAKVTDFDADT
jgi:hypothetical protein